jgi:[acyl-carrier-protein] S-malonyltransferase
MTVAWLFPGQGSQAVGMGRDLYDASPAARAVFEEADAELGWAISKLCFEGPESDLTLTQNGQPAIVTTSMATLAAMRERLPNLAPPAFTAGHSLGEYSALVAAGSLKLRDAVRIAHRRGAAMQRAVPVGEGTMAALMGGTPEQIKNICGDAAQGQVVAPANFNAPGQVVIAGHSQAVDRAVSLAKAAGLRAIPLKVSAPFHCSLMAPAAAEVEEELGRIELAPPRFPVVSNVEGTPNADTTRIPGLLVQQVDSPVLWDRSILAMTAAGVTHALEIGNGKVLAGLAKRIDKNLKVLSVSNTAEIDGIEAFLQR